jgi:hypothetical protein
MAAIHKLNRKKQSERRTALLGLVADQPEHAGVCLTSEEMAELLEDKCSLERKEQYFRHIAACKDCYREWLTLHDILDAIPENKRESGSRIFQILKPGKIAFFGTLLAAAASVVVFLNINYKVTEKDTPPVPIASMRQEPPSPGQEKEKSPPEISLQTEKPADGKNVRNPEKSVVTPETSTKKRETNVSNDAHRIEKKKSLPVAPEVNSPAPASAPKEGPPVQRSFSAEQSLPKTSGEDVTRKAIRPRAGSGMLLLQQNGEQIEAITFDQWREQVEKGCAERQESVTFWREIEKKGRQLQARLEELNQSEMEILESLLPLMYEIEKKNVAERCRRVMDLLAEERTNR